MAGEQASDTYRGVIERSNERISISIFGGGHGRLGLDDGVDATHYR